MVKKSPAKKPTTKKKTVATLRHEGDKRKNIPTAEYEAVIEEHAKAPLTVRYPRNTDLDPQLVWRGKDEQDWSDLVVHAPPLYIQEKVHPKVLIDDLLRASKESAPAPESEQLNLWSDFNGVAEGVEKTEFYQHDQNWSNRMILGDSLQVMASLAEREGLRGKVQCIYIDPPYGIKFNSNFQWSTTSREVKDGSSLHITREPEVVRAFRDTWRDGIHSYLAFLRDRLTVCRDLLSDSGSIFVQIGDENVHRLRALMDELFGEENFVSAIAFRKTAAVSSPQARLNAIAGVFDTVLWYAKRFETIKYRQLFLEKSHDPESAAGVYQWNLDESGRPRRLTDDERTGRAETSAHWDIFALGDTTSAGYSESLSRSFGFQGREFSPGASRHWSTTLPGVERLSATSRQVV